MGCAGGASATVDAVNDCASCATGTETATLGADLGGALLMKGSLVKKGSSKPLFKSAKGFDVEVAGADTGGRLGWLCAAARENTLNAVKDDRVFFGGAAGCVCWRRGDVGAD